VQTHIFLCELAYHLLVAIEKTLRDGGLYNFWGTVREQLATHQVVTVNLLTSNGNVLSIRLAAAPEPIHQQLYDLLGVSADIIKPAHTLRPPIVIQARSNSAKSRHWRKARVEVGLTCGRRSAHDGWRPCDVSRPRTLFPGLSSVGSIASITLGSPRLRLTAEARGRHVTRDSGVPSLLSRVRAQDPSAPWPHDGAAQPSLRPILAAVCGAPCHQSALLRRTAA